MRHAAVKDLFSYWNDLRGERSAPERDDMDPRAIRHILADTFLLDLDESQLFPFRLCGTRLDALLGGEQKDRSFLSLWRKDERPHIVSVLLAVADGACPVVAGAVGQVAGEPEVALELLVLPVRHQGKTHSRLMGILTPMKTPAWLGAKPAGDLTLRSLRVVNNEETRGLKERRDESLIVRAARDRRDTVLGKKSGAPFLQVIEGGGSAHMAEGPTGLARLHNRLGTFQEDRRR